jgi:hypothetical protein
MTDDDSGRKHKHISVVPIYVSQHTSLPVLGMKDRAFREWVRSEGLPAVRRGKDVLVRMSDIVERLEAKAKGPAKVETNRERLRRIAGLGGGK